MTQAEEWDWPPRRRPAPEPVDGRIRAETIVLPRQVPRSRRGGSLANRLASAFSTGVFGLFRLALILALCGVLFAALTLIGAVVRA